VIWNGININSQTSGQTDFNAINSLSFDNITVKSGGGSVLYGSSAIGGSIHLNSDLAFYDTFENELFLKYGSFNTFDGRFQTKIRSEEHTSELQSRENLVCRLLLEKKNYFVFLFELASLVYMCVYISTIIPT